MIREKRFYCAFFALTLSLALQNLLTFGVNMMDTVMLGRYSQDAMSGVIDRLGRDVTATPAGEGWAHVAATAMASPVLFGWLAQFGDAVVVEKPTSLARAYADHLRAILAAHGEGLGAGDDGAVAEGGTA